ncbi:MAG: hypothetical protein ACR2J4_11080 [Deinococcus sp.]
MKPVSRLILRLALGGLSTLLLGSAARPPLVEAHTLTQTFGGVLLQASFQPRGHNSLSGAWYDGGRAKLLRCSPHCRVVTRIPLDGPLMTGQDSVYRVVLAGHFRSGQRLKLVMRFENLQLVTVTVGVGR